MILRRILFITLALIGPVRAVAGPADEATAVVERWVATFVANDGPALVKLYAPDAIVLGTVSPILAEGEPAISAYFAGLRPGGTAAVAVTEQRVVVLGDSAVLLTGFYDFSRMKDGERLVTPARFSFVVIKRGSDWLIGHHHSSQRPKPPQ